MERIVRLGPYIVCSRCTARKWRLRLLDAHNAFLQSRELERLLLLTPPFPLPPGIGKGSIFVAKGFLYGTRDAGRGKWLKLKSVMIETGWKSSRLELALWYLYGEEESEDSRVLVGDAVTHVHDILTAGYSKSESHINATERMKAALNLSAKFRLCATVARKSSREDVLHGTSSTLASPWVHVSTVWKRSLSRRPGAKFLMLLLLKKNSLRSQNGILCWMGRQQRVDFTMAASWFAQGQNRATVGDLQDFNKIVREVKEHRDVALEFNSVGMTNCEGWSFMDSSLNNVDDKALGDKVRSQSGCVGGITSETIEEGKSIKIVHILDWNSFTVKRVCRASLRTGAYGVCDGIEACEWIRAVLFEIDNYDVPVHDILQRPDRRRCVWYSDANALTSHCKKDCGLVSNNQLRIVIASIREALQDKLNDLWWCDTSVQLADGLTKLEAERGYIRAAMASCNLEVVPDAEGNSKKQMIRDGHHRRAAEQKRLKLQVKENDSRESSKASK